MSNADSSSSGRGVTSQGLLTRHPRLSREEFKKQYQRHASVAMPWALANGVSYYAQVHGPLRWTSPEMERKYAAAGININDYDAAAEMAFPPIVTIDDVYRAKVGKEYHVRVIIPDEKRFLVSEALEHIKFVEPGAVMGERTEFIIDGRPLVECEEWQQRWEEVQQI